MPTLQRREYRRVNLQPLPGAALAPLPTFLPELIAYARYLLGGRQRRTSALPEIELGDHSWDMLLDLFVLEGEGRSTSISSVCVGSGAPATTALRHLTRLVELGHIHREKDSNDARRTFVRLSPDMRGRIQAFLEKELATLRVAVPSLSAGLNS
jgi:hypothetical protein